MGDNTTLFFKDNRSIGLAFTILKQFEKTSGIPTLLNKFNKLILPKECKKVPVVFNEFITLGIWFSENTEELISSTVHSALLTQSRIWVCGLIQIFPSPSMFRMSAKVVLLNSLILGMSDGFLLMMFLCLWLLLLLVVGWITATHFSGTSPNSIYANYSTSKIVQPELYQTPVDTPV